MREPPSAVVIDAVSLEVRVKHKVRGRMEAVDRGGPRVVDFMALLKQVHRTSQSPDRSKFQSSPFFMHVFALEEVPGNYMKFPKPT